MEAMSSRMESGSLKVLYRRDREIFREGARAIDANTDRVAAQVPPACATVAAIAARDVTFTRNAIAGLQSADLRAEIDDAATILMAHGHGHRDGFLRPRIPL